MEPEEEDDHDERHTDPDFSLRSFIPCIKSKSKKDKKEQESESYGCISDTGPKITESETVPSMDTDSTDSQKESCVVKNGVCIVISNGEFAHEPDRKGMLWDGRLAMEVFEKLGFKIVFYFNKTSKDLIDSLTEVVGGKEKNVENLDQYDCLVVIISSHGAEHQTVSENDNVKRFVHTISTKDGIVETDRIVQCFERCRSLKGKPKLFFIQACRARMTNSGDRLEFTDSGVEIEVGIKSKVVEDVDQRKIDSFNNEYVSLEDARHAMPETFIIGGKRYDEHTSPQPQPEDMVEVVDTPCYTDCLLMFASPPGKFAWSDIYSSQYKKQGGWLLLSLYNILMPKIQRGESFELFEALTEVCLEMARNYETVGNRDLRFNELVSVPCINHMLRKDVCFKPKSAD